MVRSGVVTGVAGHAAPGGCHQTPEVSGHHGERVSP